MRGTASAKALDLNFQQDKSTPNVGNKNRGTKKVFLPSAARHPVWLSVTQAGKAALNLAGDLYNY